MFVYEFIDTVGNSYCITAFNTFEAISFIFDEIINGEESLMMAIRKIEDEKELNEKNLLDEDGEYCSLNDALGELGEEDIPCILCDTVDE
jgi:hypothetical protein